MKMTSYSWQKGTNTQESGVNEHGLHLASMSIPQIWEEYHSQTLNDQVRELVEFLDERKSVFLIQKEYELKQPELAIEPNIIKYAKSESVSWEDLLFIDTETTGLSRGAGTYVFLVGIGFWQGDFFKEELYYLADLSGEKLMMRTILNRVAEFKTFVSYNGKSFDIPLIQTRLIMSEIDFDGCECTPGASQEEDASCQ